MNPTTRKKPALWLAVRLPHLSLEVLGHSYNSAPAVVLAQKRQVHHCNALALAEGVTCGMSLSTAQALSSGRTLERDSECEQQALQQIAKECYRFTPYIEIQPHQGLLLEVSRSLTLFRGIENLVDRLSQTLDQLPFHYHYGLGHTARAAWLLSRQNYPISNQDNTDLFRQRLQQVPLDQLEAFPKAIKTLQQSGFFTLADIAAQSGNGTTFSNAAIGRRTGQAFTEYLEELFGHDGQLMQGQLFAKPPATFQPEDIFQEHIQFDYPIGNSEQLREPMRQLLENLIDKLVRGQKQCHSIQWRLFDIYQNSETLTVSSERIHSQWQLPLDLTLIQLEQIDLPFEVDSLELICQKMQPVSFANPSLVGASLSTQLSEESERLFARLTARLGKNALHKISYNDDPLPENCQQKISITGTSQMELPPQHLNGLRPSWLFDPPQPVQQHQQQLSWHGPLQILQGPERIQGRWWSTPASRDYFLAQRSDFLRCWIYQDLKSRLWYVHGVF